MGNVFDILGKVGGIAGDALNFAGNQITNSQNRSLMREQNAFNANEAQKNRDFQAQEAQIARDWQEQQYNQYSSPQAMVRQYQEAGLNPALMYGQNLQSGTGSSPTASGSSASGSAAVMNAPQFGNIVQNLATLAKIKQDIAESKSREVSNYASAENAFAGASTQRSQASLNYTVKNLTKKQISEIDSKIKLMSQQEITEKRKQRLMVVQTALHSAESKQINLQNALSDAFEQRFGYKADSNTINTLMVIAGQVVSSTVSSVFDILGLFKGRKKAGNNVKFIPFTEVTGNVE